jgi:hypothetical protein
MRRVTQLGRNPAFEIPGFHRNQAAGNRVHGESGILEAQAGKLVEVEVIGCFAL